MIRVHCLPVCKNRFEKFARIFSRQHKQTTFSDAGFLGILSVKDTAPIKSKFNGLDIFGTIKICSRHG